MPVLELRRPPLVRELRRQKASLGHLFAPDIKEIGESFGLRHIDHGTGTVIFSSDNFPSKVFGIDHVSLDPISMKSKIYLHKILAILFPHNFPLLYEGFGAEKEVHSSFSGTVREKITKSIPPPQEIKYPFSKVREICKQWDIKFDINGANYFRTKDGEEFFIDTIQVTPSIIESLDRMIEFMNSSTEYTEKDRRRVNGFIQRLRILNKTQKN